jgi:cardiolipin synthase
VILEFFSAIVILSLVNDNRSPSYKLAWVSIAMLMPIAGHIMYLLWGKPGTTKKIERQIMTRMKPGLKYAEQEDGLLEEFEKQYPDKDRMVRYMSNCGFPLYKNNEVSYYPMGEDVFQAIFQDLEEAKHFIFLHFFIVAEGAIWDRLHDILKKKIKEGVEVKFLYDDFGAALRTDKNFKSKLEAEGFQVRVFNPIHRYTEKLYMNYRSHQKILVVDGNIGYTGGFNLADEYANLIERFGVWKDNGIRLVGDGVWGLTVTFLQMWDVCGHGEISPYESYMPTKKFPPSKVYTQVISDGPANNPENPIESVYGQMIHTARRFLYITTPYLIIEDYMKLTLIEAVKSGVDVRIITPNIPDKKNVKLLTNYNYGQLLKNGVRIFEYTPGFIHAKTIINEDCGIVGTINMDYRSFYLHYENGVWMAEAQIIERIKQDLLYTMEISKEITYEEWMRRPLRWKLYQPVLNLFSTLM